MTVRVTREALRAWLQERPDDVVGSNPSREGQYCTIATFLRAQGVILHGIGFTTWTGDVDGMFTHNQIPSDLADFIVAQDLYVDRQGDLVGRDALALLELSA